jgi:hypothetical protein
VDNINDDLSSSFSISVLPRRRTDCSKLTNSYPKHRNEAHPKFYQHDPHRRIPNRSIGTSPSPDAPPPFKRPRHSPRPSSHRDPTHRPILFMESGPIQHTPPTIVILHCSVLCVCATIDRLVGLGCGEEANEERLWTCKRRGEVGMEAGDGSWIPMLTSFIPSIEVVTDILIWYPDPCAQSVALSSVVTQPFEPSPGT